MSQGTKASFLYSQVRSFYDLFHASRVELWDQWGHSALSIWNSASQIHFVVPADVLAAQICIEKKVILLLLKRNSLGFIIFQEEKHYHKMYINVFSIINTVFPPQHLENKII